MPLRLTLRTPLPIPIEVFGVRADLVREMSTTEVGQLPIVVGRDTVPLADVFTLEGSPEDTTLIWSGQLDRVKGIAAGMLSGQVRVEGSCGSHLAAGMAGGSVAVEGNAGGWVGAHMKAGLVVIHGNGGHWIGGGYPGSRRGMTGGEIVVLGNCGDEAGRAMRRGTIAIAGNAGHSLGGGMLAGTIAVAGSWGEFSGTGMKRGTLLSLLPNAPRPASFRAAAVSEPTFVRVLARRLAQLGLPQFLTLDDQSLQRFSGDFLAGARGEILLPVA